MNKIILIVVIMLSFNIQAENRFSISLEYELMNNCVGNTRYSNKKIKICECALTETMENGWKLDYDNDEDYSDDAKEFNQNFSKNIKECSKKYKRM